MWIAVLSDTDMSKNNKRNKFKKSAETEHNSVQKWNSAAEVPNFWKPYWHLNKILFSSNTIHAQKFFSINKLKNFVENKIKILHKKIKIFSTTKLTCNVIFFFCIFVQLYFIKSSVKPFSKSYCIHNTYISK